MEDDEVEDPVPEQENEGTAVEKMFNDFARARNAALAIDDIIVHEVDGFEIEVRTCSFFYHRQKVLVGMIKKMLNKNLCWFFKKKILCRWIVFRR